MYCIHIRMLYQAHSAEEEKVPVHRVDAPLKHFLGNSEVFWKTNAITLRPKRIIYSAISHAKYGVKNINLDCRFNEKEDAINNTPQFFRDLNRSELVKNQPALAQNEYLRHLLN